jgi:hypothetical protein
VGSINLASIFKIVSSENKYISKKEKAEKNTKIIRAVNCFLINAHTTNTHIKINTDPDPEIRIENNEIKAIKKCLNFSRIKKPLAIIQTKSEGSPK